LGPDEGGWEKEDSAMLVKQKKGVKASCPQDGRGAAVISDHYKSAIIKGQCVAKTNHVRKAQV